MGRIISVLPHAGGNVDPTLEILSELRQRGHEVLVLGHAQLEEIVSAAGIRFSRFRAARPWSASVERPSVRSMAGFLRIASDRGIGRDLTRESAEFSPDLVLVDCMVPGALRAARATGAPVALVMHTLISYWAQQWSARSTLGQWLRLTRNLPGSRPNRPDLALLTTMPELDPLPHRTRVLRGRIAQTGPVMSPIKVEGTGTAIDPPTVLISLSTISYPGQQELLQRLVDAMAGLRVNAIVTTGPSIDPSAIAAPANVEVREFLRHDEILPHVSVVVGHGGHGTTMRALAHGRPVLIVPLSSVADHELVADAVTAAGIGAQIGKHASIDALRTAVADLLGNGEILTRAVDWGGRLRLRSGASDAADALEALLT